MSSMWTDKPIRFGPHGEADAKRRVADLYGTAGVYVYIVGCKMGTGGVVSVYAGKTANLGWRFVQHITNILGLMYEIYDENGQVVLGGGEAGSHYQVRLATYADFDRLEQAHRWARDHLARTTFWYAPMREERDRERMESWLIQRLQRLQSPEKLRCINGPAPTRAEEPEAPCLPPDPRLTS